MNIVILAGGTGSIALQTGLYEFLDSSYDGFDTKVIVNAYDNGLSTGAVRKVCGGKILGPSDVRKNQTTRLKLENPSSPWNKFLDVRFTVESQNAKQFCFSKVDELAQDLGCDNHSGKMLLLKEAIDAYFSIQVATKIDYTDFSLANVVYAGFASANKNSLRTAATIMAELMGIKDNVLLNDDRSLFLGAITSSGIRVTDEGDIVSWGNVDDPFVDVFFTDENGNECLPVLCEEAKNAIRDAHLIILSSGTQWSSLIPTYASEGFKEAIRESSAKVIMVMNRQPDKDSPGQTASDIIRLIVPRFFDEGRIHLIMDGDGHENMSTVDSHATRLLASTFIFKNDALTIEDTGTKHNPRHLASAVASLYFLPYLQSDHFMFDYDDTLVGRGNYQKKSSAANKKMICYLNSKGSVSICTGNSIKAIAMRVYESNVFGEITTNRLKVYADGGINLYEYDTTSKNESDDGFRPDLIKCVNPQCQIETGGVNGITHVMHMLQEVGIPYSKIENRGNVMICIKPIQEEYRTITLNLVRLILKNSNLIARASGRTTIEICKPQLSKQDAVKHELENGVQSITFVGDELKSGNDAVVAEMNDPRIKCLLVRDPAETAFFLKTLLINLALT